MRRGLQRTVLALAAAAGIMAGSLRDLAGDAPLSGNGAQQEQHFEREITITVKLNYLLYLPPGYDSETKAWPLVLFLHGSGERGSDLNLVKRMARPS